MSSFCRTQLTTTNSTAQEELEMWEMHLEPMTVSSVTKGLLMVIVTIVFGMWYQWRKKHPALDLIPGPRGLPVVGNLLEFAFNGFAIIPTFRKFAEKYDGIYRFECGDSARSTFIMLSRPEYLQTFYSSKVNVNRSDQYTPIGEAVGDCVFIASGDRWKKLRKMAMWDFFSIPADQLNTAFQRAIDPMIAALKEKADGTIFPCKRIIQRATANSMNETSLGEPLSKGIEHILTNTSDNIMKIAYQRNFYIHYFSDRIFSWLPAGKRFYSEVEEMNDIVMKLIQRKKAELQEIKRKGEAVPNIHIYNLIDSDESDKSLVDEFKIMFISGADTSSTTMGFMMTCLGLHPEVQEKVYEEDREIQKRLGGREMTVEDLRDYQYLDRVMRETLRLFPIGPLIARKMSEDTFFGKYMVPKGTNVAALQISANFDPKVFPEPRKFDPDRYLPERAKNIPPYAFNPFSAGPRSCPGSRYATMVIKIYLAAIIRNFKVKSGYLNVDDVWKNVDAEITLKDRSHYPVSLELRV